MDIRLKKASLLFGAVVLGVVAGASLLTNSYHLFSKNEAASEQTERRLYVYLEGDWDNKEHMYIYYWGGEVGSEWTASPEMPRLLNDYHVGLFYFDVPVDVTHFLVKAYSGDTGKISNQSADILVADLLDEGDYKAIAVEGWVADDTKRVARVVDAIGMSSLQAAAVLNNIDSCSKSYASGYNAWPQLKDLIIDASELDGATVVTDNFGDSTTIAEKTAYLEAKYLADQAGL